jgi:hypothetical protein
MAAAMAFSPSQERVLGVRRGVRLSLEVEDIALEDEVALGMELGMLKSLRGRV